VNEIPKPAIADEANSGSGHTKGCRWRLLATLKEDRFDNVHCNITSSSTRTWHILPALAFDLALRAARDCGDWFIVNRDA